MMICSGTERGNCRCYFGIERIAIGRNKRRGKTGIGIEIVEMFFFFVEIERIAKCKKQK